MVSGERRYGAAVAVVTLLLLAPASAQATIVDSGFSKSAVRPGRICVASAVCVHKMTWRAWGTNRATGRGELRINNRTEQNQFTISRTTLTLSRPKRGLFTRATWRYRSGNAGESRYSWITPEVGAWSIWR